MADSIWCCDNLAKVLSECQSLVDFLSSMHLDHITIVIIADSTATDHFSTIMHGNINTCPA